MASLSIIASEEFKGGADRLFRNEDEKMLNAPENGSVIAASKLFTLPTSHERQRPPGSSARPSD